MYGVVPPNRATRDVVSDREPAVAHPGGEQFDPGGYRRGDVDRLDDGQAEVRGDRRGQREPEFSSRKSG